MLGDEMWIMLGVKCVRLVCIWGERVSGKWYLL